MGLRLDLPELSPSNRCPGKLAAPLQLASPAQRHRAYVRPQLVKNNLLTLHTSQDRTPCSRSCRSSSRSRADCSQLGKNRRDSRTADACAHAPRAREHQREHREARWQRRRRPSHWHSAVPANCDAAHDASLPPSARRTVPKACRAARPAAPDESAACLRLEFSSLLVAPGVGLC